jgi:hypothetical protein
MTAMVLKEARTIKRRQVLETGLIRFGDMSIGCILRNLSEIGAALDVGTQTGIPARFTLIVIREEKVYSCNVVWRRGGRIGVSFC